MKKQYNVATKGPPKGEQLLSRSQLAEKLGLSIDSIKRMEKKGQLKPIRFNPRVIRYRVSDVDAMMSRYEVEVRSE